LQKRESEKQKSQAERASLDVLRGKHKGNKPQVLRGGYIAQKSKPLGTKAGCVLPGAE